MNLNGEERGLFQTVKRWGRAEGQCLPKVPGRRLVSDCNIH